MDDYDRKQEQMDEGGKLFRYKVGTSSEAWLYENVALVVIDIQYDFVRGSLRTDLCPAAKDAVKLISPIEKLCLLPFKVICLTKDWHPAGHISFHENRLKWKVSEDSPIQDVENAKLYDTVKFVTEDGRTISQTLWPTHCVRDTQGATISPEFKLPKPWREIRKGTIADVESYSAFGDPDRVEDTKCSKLLNSFGIETVVLCGIAFDYCVGKTAIDAVNLGYRVVLVEDACVMISRETEAEMRKELLKAGVIFTTLEQISNTLADEIAVSQSNTRY